MRNTLSIISVNSSGGGRYLQARERADALFVTIRIIDEFTTKKLAEVQTFLDIKSDIRTRAGAIFAEKASAVAALYDKLDEQDKLEGNIITASIPPKQREIFASKRTKTAKKLTAMMELYVGDNWDNPVEVLECTSFFAGAGAAHTALAASLIQAEDSLMHTLLESLKTVFCELLGETIEQLPLTARG